jgi:IS5 family transposase
MFKILILQRYYNLSDEQTEYQINDRMSFMRFLDLTIADDIPDSRTIWKFTEQITDLELTEPLFKRFEEELVKLNLIVNEGKIIDASFVEAPRQRNSKEENARIKKEGAAPKQWEESPEKLAQKDVDARWTKKNNQTYYGYKNHTKVDSESKLISNYLVTDASVHDSQALDQLLEEKDKGEQISQFCLSPFHFQPKRPSRCYVSILIPCGVHEVFLPVLSIPEKCVVDCRSLPETPVG